MRIFIDVDGVLASFTENVVQVANDLWSERNIPSDYMPKDWEYSDLFTCEQWKEIWAEIHNIPDFWLRSFPIESNVYDLSEWLDRHPEHEPYFITSRRDTGRVSARAQTQLWLAEYGLYPEHAHVIAVTDPKDKKFWIEKYKIDMGIDDYPPTVSSLNTLSWHHCFTNPGIRIRIRRV